MKTFTDILWTMSEVAVSVRLNRTRPSILPRDITPRKPRWALVLLTFLALAMPAKAYPPAPHHLIFGLVRDELCNPITSTTAEIILTAASGQKITTHIDSGTEPGVNY